MRSMLLPFFIVFGSVFSFIHIIALELYLYWRYPWIDLPMHFFGGIVVVLSIFSLASMNLVVKESWLRIGTVLGVLFVVAVGWELYELIIGAPKEANYIADTSVDLILGMLGGLCGYYLSSRFYNSNF